MLAFQRHLGGVEILCRMFSHYYKVQVIRLRRRDDVFEVAAAVAAEKGVNMNDAFKLSEAAVVFGLSALGIQLLNRRMQPAEFVTTIGEGELREQHEDQQDQ